MNQKGIGIDINNDSIAGMRINNNKNNAISINNYSTDSAALRIENFSSGRAIRVNSYHGIGADIRGWATDTPTVQISNNKGQALSVFGLSDNSFGYALIAVDSSTNSGAIYAHHYRTNTNYSTIYTSSLSNNTSIFNLGNPLVTVGGIKSSISSGNSMAVIGIVKNTATSSSGILGINERAGGGSGVYGMGNYTGVLGTAMGSYPTAIAIVGQTSTDGITVDPGGLGIYSLNNMLAEGDVYSNGGLYVLGAKYFRIDHPLDPENKYLKHICAESPEALNIYRGNIILDENGEAIVKLPDYFEAININFSYHLTPIGASSPDLYIKSEVKNNQFIIAGGKPNIKVSWEVYGERNDLYMQNNPEAKNPEPYKEIENRGRYLKPEFYNKPYNLKIGPTTEKDINDKILMNSKRLSNPLLSRSQKIKVQDEPINEKKLLNTEKIELKR